MASLNFVIAMVLLIVVGFNFREGALYSSDGLLLGNKIHGLASFFLNPPQVFSGDIEVNIFELLVFVQKSS